MYEKKDNGEAIYGSFLGNNKRAAVYDIYVIIIYIYVLTYYSLMNWHKLRREGAGCATFSSAATRRRSTAKPYSLGNKRAV